MADTSLEAVPVLMDAGDPTLRHEHDKNGVWTRRTRVANRRVYELEQEIQRSMPKPFVPREHMERLNWRGQPDVLARKMHEQAEEARRAQYDRELRATQSRAFQQIDKAFDDLDQLLTENTQRSAQRAVARTEEAVSRQGAPTPRSLRRGVSNKAAAEAHADAEALIRAALDKQRHMAKRKVRAALNESDPVERAKRIKYALVGGPNKESPYPGGTTSRAVRTIFVTEQSRSMRAAEIAYMRRAEVALAYWRLSSRHPFYGGKEVCEHYAFNHDPAAAALLAALGLAGRFSLQGLYLLDNVPQIPHPNCLCYREPLVLPAESRADALALSAGMGKDSEEPDLE